MHDYSLPAGDRSDATTTEAKPADQRAALVVQLGDGTYFRSWSTNGRGVSVRALSRARLFSRGDDELARTLAKLRRKKFVAAVVEVKVTVGSAGR